ncbi:DUF1329 domain-containing protein [Pseudomonas sp. GD03860]|uniref:DUF1329 domain-containing protein n=1 Tax=Pseudomonas TaxID=286 RepID=UPI00236460C0|nr:MULTISPECIES: DUF1329 domain-containing protein [Pseudomonas]MDD2058460.1 DUF1329 domain-containing protein [Pseudomonas putida]MDH0640439.1 DUF1329 domain-containing protein [Pseudomonas sp. GD03860]
MMTPFKKSLLGSALIALFSVSTVQAATSADLARLGGDLTPFGAEKSGNASGSIPAWNGGLTQAPAGWQPGHGDPYGSDKPLYSVDSKNLVQYQALLPAGQAALIKQYPGYRLDVYPTHRSCTFPAQIAQRTKEFAGQSKIGSDGWNLEQAVGAAIPFPVPQTGIEVMWNYKLRYMAVGRRAQISLLVREKSGELSEFKQWASEFYPYNDPAVKSPADTGGIEAKLLYDVLSPSSRAGEMYLVHGYLDKPQDSWIYFPGQRRVRRAPSFAYDNPIAGTDSLYFVDQINMFTGAMDRYDFKLIGKKEMLVPYNSYKLIDKRNKYADLIGQDYLNRDVQRYEQHRVWVVEATVKADKRHSFAKRVFFVDEDSWTLLHVDMYDAKGNLWRVQEGSLWANPQTQSCTGFEYTSYDLTAHRYIADNFTQEGEILDLTAGLEGRVSDKLFNSNELRRRGER